MDVRCEKCQAEYEFEDARVTDAGVSVKCTQCGNVFRVRKTNPTPSAPRATSLAPVQSHGDLRASVSPGSLPSVNDKSREWKVRQANGNLFTCKELTTLQKWIIERKVNRDDQISLTGENWKRLGDIGELASFFQVVEEAAQAQKFAALAQSGLYPPTAPGLTPEEEFHAPKRSATPWILALLLLISGGAAGYYGYFHWYLPVQFEKAALLRLEEERVLALKAAEEKAAADVQAKLEALKLAAAAVLDAGVPTGAGTTSAVEAGGDAGVVGAAISPPDAGSAVQVKLVSGTVPKGYEDWVSLGDRMLQSDRPQRALDAYGKAADLEPERVEPMVGRGLAFLDLGKLPQAEAAFSQSLKKSPKFGEALMGLAETYQGMGKKDAAIEYYQKYLDVLPNGRESEVARRAIRKLKGD